MITHLFHNFHIGSFFSYMTPLQFCKRRPQLLAMEITTELISLGGGGLIKRIREAGGVNLRTLLTTLERLNFFVAYSRGIAFMLGPKDVPNIPYDIMYGL